MKPLIEHQSLAKPGDQDGRIDGVGTVVKIDGIGETGETEGAGGIDETGEAGRSGGIGGRPQSAGSARALCLILFFSVTLLLCCGTAIYHAPTTVLQNQKRYAAPFPELPDTPQSMSAFPWAFEAFFQDRFACDSLLLHARDTIKYYLFGTSGAQPVTVGKDGWLFYRPDTDAFVQISHARTPFSEEELGKWKDAFELRQKWLAERGIHYIIAVAPVKLSVYPECAAEGFERKYLTRKVDQLLAYLKANTRLDVLDLRNELIGRKSSLANTSSPPLYYHFDSHWNDLGAFYGYRALVGALSKWFPTMKAEDWSNFKVAEDIESDGDLAGMLDLGGAVRANGMHLVPVRTPLPRRIYEVPLDKDAFYSSAQTYVSPQAGLPKAVMLCDSFTLALREWLAGHFSKITYFFTANFSDDMILAEKPDVFIQEILERNLIAQVPSNKWSDPAIQAEFEKAKAIGYETNCLAEARRDWFLDPDSHFLAEGQAIDIRSLSDDPKIILPAVKGCPRVLKVELFSPVDSYAQVFFLGKGNQDFDEANSVRASTHVGHNVLYLGLPPGLHGPLQLDPGASRGIYRIYKIELR